MTLNLEVSQSIYITMTYFSTAEIQQFNYISWDISRSQYLSSFCNFFNV